MRYVSDTVCWELCERPAARPLRPHVIGYAGYREWGSAGFRRLETPSDEVHVILSFGPRIRTNGELVESFVAAPHTEHAVVESGPEGQYGVEIRLTPLGAHLVLGRPMDELARQTVPFEDAWGDGELIERLHDLASWDARFDLLDAVLAERLAVARPLAPEVERAWARLVATGGTAPVAELVRDAGWSRRHFTARFSEAAGLPPKSFARVLRFHRAKELLGRPGLSLTEIALACGYYDQAHFNRDFRSFAGCTPTELMARRLPAGWSADEVAAAEVTSVQDGARAAA
ncbi:MAG TPA: helix-turn-helix domain-containing protein [Solirubrobacteraceae bacterium]|nr:helix-turn-helix domain-containing protein [Solirubrobacteraceae bacterium]